MTKFYQDVTTKLVTFIRNKVPDPAGRGEERQESFPTDGVTKDFTLTYKALKNVKRAYLDDGTEYIEFVDFDVHYDKKADPASFPVISFKIAPPSGRILTIEYHTGQTWVYPGYPQEDFTPPRISIMHISSRQEEVGLGRYFDSNTKAHQAASWYQVDVWTKRGQTFVVEGKTIGGGKLLDYLCDLIMDAFKDRELLKKWGFDDVLMRMARDISYAEDTKLLRKLINFDITHRLMWSG
jgi:hypothetical protein